jgi:sirohydrochlorin ferrochelatase
LPPKRANFLDRLKELNLMGKVMVWCALLIASLLLGSLYVQFLVTHPLRMSTYLAFSYLALFAIVVILARYFRGGQRFIAASLSVAVFAVGWYVMTGVVLDREDYRPIPELTRAKGDPGKGHTAVVYLTHGEPPVYDPISWVNQMNEFDEQGIPFVPFMARPFFFKNLRDHYLEVGKSEHREKHVAMIKSLEQAYRDVGDSETRFYLSFLDDNPRAPAAVIRALNDGASRIIVSEVFVTISSHTEEGEHQVREVDPEAYGAELLFTGPLWESELMHRMYLTRVNANRGNTPRSKVGVLLVAHGQPAEWDEIWPTQTSQELAYGDKILDLFVADGYPRENLSKAWMSFKTPKPALEVEKLHARGIEKLFFFSYTIAAAGMHSQYDIPALVHQAAVPEDFPIINLGAWGNDPLVIAALKERIDAQL